MSSLSDELTRSVSDLISGSAAALAARLSPLQDGSIDLGPALKELTNRTLLNHSTGSAGLRSKHRE